MLVPGRKMTTGVEQTTVIIVGAGPSGLATAACLHKKEVPYIILEREDCIASLFNKKAYDRLHLQLPKKHCELPHFHYPNNYPTYIPRLDFLKYLDDYASHFNINPKFLTFVTNAKYNEESKKWKVEAKQIGDSDDNVRCYEGRFLVVATGENSDAFTPDVDGLSEFKGEVIHSTKYKSGKGYENKSVLVVGAGNSGMDIAFDLSNYGAKASLVVRSPIHILPKWLPSFGPMLLNYFSLQWVDALMMFVSKVVFGDLTKYGIKRPKEGPFFLAGAYGKYPVIDVGTCKKIRSREIQILPALKSIRKGGDEVVFENEKCYQFDSIIFATGFKRSTHLWLQGDGFLNEDGLPKQSPPDHWKGENGIYSAGLGRYGLHGTKMDAQNIADDIFNLISK